MKKIYLKIASDSLYRNSAFLLASNIIMSAFGFIFWALSARIFTTGEIGLASTLISGVDLVVSFTLLGLNIGLVRFLPISVHKNDKINSVLTLVVITSIIGSLIFITGLKLFSPKLSFLHNSVFVAFMFVLFVISTNMSEVVKNIFKAFRSSQFVLLNNTILNISKITLVLLFISMGTLGLFYSWLTATALAVIISFIILVKKYRFVPNFTIKVAALKKIFSFSFANYISEFLDRAPRFGLPILITSIAGAEQTAYFYIDMSIASFLFLLPEAIVASFYAESSANEKELSKNTLKTLKAFALILIPSTLFFILFGEYILLFFGKDYSSEGLLLLKILTLSTFPVALNSLFANIFKVKFNMRIVIIVNLIGSALILYLSAVHLKSSLSNVGWAFLTGNILMNFLYLIPIFLYRRK